MASWDEVDKRQSGFTLDEVDKRQSGFTLELAPVSHFLSSAFPNPTMLIAIIKAIQAV